jgi:pimeloyl-ACP methyl ester carboxylesterase
MNIPGNILTLNIPGGATLRYLKTGDGPPLVLIHTIRTQLEYFRDAIPLLAGRYTVYAVDLPGHGYSSIDKKVAYDEPCLRKAIIAFIDTLDLRDVTLVGESIGGVLALTTAGTRPDRIKTVIASNPYDYDLRYGDGVRRGNFIANAIIGSFGIPLVGIISAHLENKLLLGLVLKGGFHASERLPDDLLSEFNRTGRRRGYRYVERSIFSGWRSWGEARRLYSDIQAPVTLIYGDDDWSRPHERQRTADGIPRVAVTTLECTGHFAFLERPQEITDIILQTLESRKSL